MIKSCAKGALISASKIVNERSANIFQNRPLMMAHRRRLRVENVLLVRHKRAFGLEFFETAFAMCSRANRYAAATLHWLIAVTATSILCAIEARDPSPSRTGADALAAGRRTSQQRNGGCILADRGNRGARTDCGLRSADRHQDLSCLLAPFKLTNSRGSASDRLGGLRFGRFTGTLRSGRLRNLVRLISLFRQINPFLDRELGGTNVSEKFALALTSSFSLATILPLTLPRTTADCD